MFPPPLAKRHRAAESVKRYREIGRKKKKKKEEEEEEEDGEPPKRLKLSQRFFPRKFRGGLFPPTE